LAIDKLNKDKSDQIVKYGKLKFSFKIAEDFTKDPITTINNILKSD